MAAKKKTEKKPPSAPAAAQQLPSSSEIIKGLKNSIKIYFGDAEENVVKIFDSVIQQLAAAAQQINKQAAHINALETFFKDNGIPLDVIIPKAPGAPGPNREIRRKIAKVAEKHKKSKKA